MPLDTNDISFANIQIEFGGTNPISLNEYYAGGSFVPSGVSGVNGLVPSSGAISCLDLAGVELLFVYASYFVDGAGDSITTPVGAINSNGVTNIVASVNWVPTQRCIMTATFNPDGTFAYNPIKYILFNPGATINFKSSFVRQSDDSFMSTGEVFGGSEARANTFFYGTTQSSTTTTRAVLSHSTYALNGGFTTMGPDGSYYMAVETSAPDGNQGVSVLKFNGLTSNENIVWAKKYTSATGNTYKIRSIHYINATNELVLVYSVLGYTLATGTTNSKALFVVKINATNGLVAAATHLYRTAGTITYRDLDAVATASDESGHIFVNKIVYFSGYNVSNEEYNICKVFNGGNVLNWHGTFDNGVSFTRAVYSWYQPSDPPTWFFEGSVKSVLRLSPTEIGFFSSQLDHPNFTKRRIFAYSLNEPTRYPFYSYTIGNTETDHLMDLDNPSSIFQQVNKPSTVGYAAITRSTSSTDNKLIIKVLPKLKTYIPVPDGYDGSPSTNYDRINYKVPDFRTAARTFGASSTTITVSDITTTSFTLTSPGAVIGNANDITKTTIYPNVVGFWPVPLSYSIPFGSSSSSATLAVPPSGGFRSYTLTITFNKPMQRGTGNILVRDFYKDGIIDDTLDAATDSGITFSGNSVSITFNALSSSAPGRRNFVIFPEGCFTDLSGNKWAGEENYYFFAIRL